MKTYRIGAIRAVDRLGRLVLARDLLRIVSVPLGSVFSQTVLVDDDGRITGILLEPLEWVKNPESAPRIVDLMRNLGGPIRYGPKISG